MVVQAMQQSYLQDAMHSENIDLGEQKLPTLADFEVPDLKRTEVVTDEIAIPALPLKSTLARHRLQHQATEKSPTSADAELQEDIDHDVESDPRVNSWRANESKESNTAEQIEEQNQSQPRRSYAQRLKDLMDSTACGAAIVNKCSGWASRSDHRRVAPNDDSAANNNIDHLDLGTVTRKVHELPFWIAEIGRAHV